MHLISEDASQRTGQAWVIGEQNSTPSAPSQMCCDDEHWRGHFSSSAMQKAYVVPAVVSVHLCSPSAQVVGQGTERGLHDWDPALSMHLWGAPTKNCLLELESDR